MVPLGKFINYECSYKKKSFIFLFQHYKVAA